MTTLASGSSVMKMGYMSIDFVNVLFCCHDRESGCWYPPCRIDLELVSQERAFCAGKFPVRYFHCGCCWLEFNG